MIGNDSDTFSAGRRSEIIARGGAADAAELDTDQRCDQGRAACHAGAEIRAVPGRIGARRQGAGGRLRAALHSDAIQAHANSFPGLVEPAVGLVPAWGGCTQMLMRQSFPVVRHVPEVFQNIARCRVANSIDEAREMKILRPGDGITMNRSRVLADAKARCLEMAKDYTPPKPPTVHLPGAVLKRIIDGKADALAQRQNHRARCGRLQERSPPYSAAGTPI